jgi:SpoVK/Ycf46/Vps4 family AAA+-type ATPase
VLSFFWLLLLQVSLGQNRVGPDVNLTTVAKRLEGYTGSDIKEVCREAVVAISHEAASALEHGRPLPPPSRAATGRWVRNKAAVKAGADEDAAVGGGNVDVNDEGGGDVDVEDEDDDDDPALFRLRPVTRKDLEASLSMLSASVNERGREASKVADWNAQYGEVKDKKKKSKPTLSM